MFSTNLLLLLVFTLTIKKTLIIHLFLIALVLDIFYDISYLVFMVQLKDLSLSKINSIQAFNEDFLVCTNFFMHRPR